METNSSEKKLEGWTKDQIFDLYEALKKFGLFDIEGLKRSLRYKTEDEIRTALEYFNDTGLPIPQKQPPPVNKRELERNIPKSHISEWAMLMIETHGFENIETETATALRLIAEYEDRPPAECTENIDFKKAYHMLADALEGRPLQDDKMILAILDKCMAETTFMSKKLNLNIDATDSEAAASTSSAATEEHTALTNLASSTAYNPLYISVDNLKLSKNPSE